MANTIPMPKMAQVAQNRLTATMTASMAVDASQGTFFGTLSAAGALGGAAGYYTGSWLILNRTSLETLVDIRQHCSNRLRSVQADPSKIPPQVSLE